MGVRDISWQERVCRIHVKALDLTLSAEKEISENLGTGMGRADH